MRLSRLRNLDNLKLTEYATIPFQLPPPSESFLTSIWMSILLLALPLVPFGWWLLGRRRRLKEYLRRRTSQRSPVVHELVVRATVDVMREQATLARAGLRLGRLREGFSRQIDAEATSVATACNAGRPEIVYARARISPEYLVLISTKGREDHIARQLDQLTSELATQNLMITRFFMAQDANLCFETAESAYFNLDQLAPKYPDHRLIFLGTGDQLLNPGTFATWSWAEDITSWKRRAILTPKPVEEWGIREVSLARLFDGPPLRANSVGMLGLAELFERGEEAGSDVLIMRRDPIQRSWAMRPQRWLNPMPPDDRSYVQLEEELCNYFVDERANFDKAAFWWFCACAIYPALRWDLTIYLGLNLTTPRARGAERIPFYTEARALRLAALPWFREGFMPDRLRRKLLSLLPKILHTQATRLLRDLLERAAHFDGQSSDAVRLQIAQSITQAKADPLAARPERDEVFLDSLVRYNPLDFQVPTSLQQLINGTQDAFISREWATFFVLAIYWLGTAMLVPWQSSGALGTAALFPLLLLPLAFVTWPIAVRIFRRAELREPSTSSARGK